MEMDRRLDAGIVVERARGNDDLSPAPRRVRPRRAAAAAECRGEAARLRQVEAPDHYLAARPAKGVGQDVNVARMCTAGCLAAARAVAIDELGKRQPRFVGDGAAEAASADNHRFCYHGWPCA